MHSQKNYFYSHSYDHEYTPRNEVPHGNNEFYNHQYDPSKDSWENQFAVESSKVNFLAWNGFKTLKKDYSNTKYYQEVINECGYFRTFVAQN